MCIAVPAEIIEIREGNIALVDFGNLKQEIRIDLVDVTIGDYVLVHVGFAIQKINRDEALETRELFRQCYESMDVEPFPA
ncbi:MAG: HypC/HybG/HupF family hydrogenase formation chaperone [Methanospirillum sp.]|uniref:HypC/HybG/HupF family hydrogenase formation chaperone n=1 Tax=Methanospirillum sp. TaxID=45200 RepID=UPI002373CA8B|nr:HypC/HybG/HupF family hydrogenase formation chaperone [Methanospirillum sp.]MDD1729188.1 HypC/HybG/HupF family hydrogenase formation chaperone [Methanospirillum sp.]